MLFAKPTPKGTGIEFWGDYNDLYCLYDTMSKLSLSEIVKERNHDRNRRLLTIVPYEVRNAFQGDREIDSAVDNGEIKTTYYGFKIDWITMLYTISALRYNAGLKPTDEIDQCNLMQLEYWTRNALYSYDPIGAKHIELFINRRIDVTTEYVYLMHQHLIHYYLSRKATKARFRAIPSILISLSNKSKLDEFISNITIKAKLLNVSVFDLECEGLNINVW